MTNLFRWCVTLSVAVHVSAYAAYRAATRPSEISSEGLGIEHMEVDFEYIPPQLIGDGGSPAPVEKREWIEGTAKHGEDPADDDFDFNAISGDGTDRDGYLFSFNGDRPPVPLIDFDLRRYYPKAAKDANITSGTVILQVQVDERGALKSAKIVSRKAGYGFDEAALMVINMSRFSPGIQKGKPVKMTHKIPVRFVLGES
jgi:protein TonB